jgi:hypothetical protein
MKSVYDPVVRCPYNAAHKMAQTKLMFHIQSGCADKVNIHFQ